MSESDPVSISDREAKDAPPSAQGVTRRRAIKVGIFTLAVALPVVMTIAPTEARGSEPS